MGLQRTILSTQRKTYTTVEGLSHSERAKIKRKRTFLREEHIKQHKIIYEFMENRKEITGNREVFFHLT